MSRRLENEEVGVWIIIFGGEVPDTILATIALGEADNLLVHFPQNVPQEPLLRWPIRNCHQKALKGFENLLQLQKGGHSEIEVALGTILAEAFEAGRSHERLERNRLQRL